MKGFKALPISLKGEDFFPYKGQAGKIIALSLFAG